MIVGAGAQCRLYGAQERQGRAEVVPRDERCQLVAGAVAGLIERL